MEYQKTAKTWILDHPKCALFLDMGLGKTAVTLSAIEELKYDYLEASKVLVIAPLRVARTVWAQEVEKWGFDLTVSIAVGTTKQRTEALRRTADMYVINREQIPWLVKHFDFDFDMVVLDELSSFKSPKAQRFRALRRVIGHVPRVVGLTGTPVPNGYGDLWAEIYLLDKGERLGKTVTKYREQHFRQTGYMGYQYKLREGEAEKINVAIADICLSMRKEGYLSMPDCVYLYHEVEPDKKARQLYKQLEADYLAELDGDVITALSAGAINTKLMQLANGAVYLEDGSVKEVHSSKLDMLGELIEAANGQPVLVFTSFRHDVTRIRERFSARVLDSDKDIADWNSGEIPIAVAHPASIGHGLNLQDGGHIVIWFGLTWSLELYQQANNRLYRQGQKDTVIIHHIVMKDSVDGACAKALKRKDAGQASLMEYLKNISY